MLLLRLLVVKLAASLLLLLVFSALTCVENGLYQTPVVHAEITDSVLTFRCNDKSYKSFEDLHVWYSNLVVNENKTNGYTFQLKDGSNENIAKYIQVKCLFAYYIVKMTNGDTDITKKIRDIVEEDYDAEYKKVETTIPQADFDTVDPGEDVPRGVKLTSEIARKNIILRYSNAVFGK